MCYLAALSANTMCKYVKDHKLLQIVHTFSYGSVCERERMEKRSVVLTLKLPSSSPVIKRLDILPHIPSQNPSEKLYPFLLLHHLENQPEITRDLLIFHWKLLVFFATFFYSG
jgi:hypothetical protein